MKSSQEVGGTPASSQSTTLLSTQSLRNFLKVIAPLGAITLLYFSTARALVSYWNDFESLTYTHGWVVLLVTLWLLFDAVAPLDKVRLCYSRAGAFGVFASSVVWLLARQINVQTIQFLLLPVLCWSAVLSLYGPLLARRYAFAIGYLYFAIPFWGEFNSLLQWGTVFAERAAVRIVGIPAYFDANTIHLPSGVIAVEGGCSGMHFFIVGLALGSLYGYVNRIASRGRLLLLAAALAILANWVRVFVILVAGHLTNMQHYLVRVEHYRFGWGVFAVMMVIFFAIAHRMKQAPEPQMSNVQGVSRSLGYAELVGFAFALFAVPVFVWASGQRAATNVASIDISAPEGWQSIDVATNHPWQPVFKNADSQVLKHFAKNGLVFDAYRAIYSTQNQQKKIAGYDNSLIGESHGVKVVATEKTSSPFIEIELSDAMGNRQLIWYAYHVDGHWFASPLKAQMWSGIKALAARPRTGVIALRADCARDCSQMKHAFEEWTTDGELRKLIDLQ